MRPVKALVALSLLAAVGLAGCSAGDKAPDESQDVDFDDLDLQATATTGIIRGVIVDEAIRPLANVTVDLHGAAGPRSTVTNAGGAFGFDGLPGGTYFLEVARPGYFSVRQSVEVVVGDPEPPVAKILLQANPATTPFVNAQVFDGFVECTTSFLVLCGAPNLILTLWCNGDLDPLPPQCIGNVTNDRFTHDFYFADNASHIQVEMVWQSSQALSPELYFEMETLNAGCDGDAADKRDEDGDASAFLNSTSGSSPIYSTVNESQIYAWEIGSKCPIYFSLFSGGITGAPCGDAVPDPPPPLPGVPGWCVGYTVQQRFSLFLHDFHHFLPPTGWRFTSDGTPTVPDT